MKIKSVTIKHNDSEVHFDLLVPLSQESIDHAIASANKDIAKMHERMVQYERGLRSITRHLFNHIREA